LIRSSVATVVVVGGRVVVGMGSVVVGAGSTTVVGVGLVATASVTGEEQRSRCRRMPSARARQRRRQGLISQSTHFN
jgi:hypothetical protein